MKVWILLFLVGCVEIEIIEQPHVNPEWEEPITGDYDLFELESLLEPGTCGELTLNLWYYRRCQQLHLCMLDVNPSGAQWREPYCLEQTAAPKKCIDYFAEWVCCIDDYDTVFKSALRTRTDICDPLEIVEMEHLCQ